MNYQLSSSDSQSISRSNVHKLQEGINRQDIQYGDNKLGQRSNSGKKFVLIRRKSSNNVNSNIQSSQRLQNNLKGHQNWKSLMNKDQQEVVNKDIKNVLNRSQQKRVDKGYQQKRKEIQTNFQQKEDRKINSSQFEMIKQKEQDNLQVSRGQFYEQQLQGIQRQVANLRYQMELGQRRNHQLDQKLNHAQSQLQIKNQLLFTFQNSSTDKQNQYFSKLQSYQNQLGNCQIRMQQLEKKLFQKNIQTKELIQKQVKTEHFSNKRLQNQQKQVSETNKRIQQKQKQLNHNLYALQSYFSIVSNLVNSKLSSSFNQPRYKQIYTQFHNFKKFQLFILSFDSFSQNQIKENQKTSCILRQHQLLITHLIQFCLFLLQHTSSFNQVISSQQISIKDLNKQINELTKQNLNISFQNERFKQLVSINEKIQFVNDSISNLQNKKNGQKLKSREQKTAESSRQEIKPQFLNKEVQTQQKRIGSAASLQKYQSARISGLNNRSSPYKNYLCQNRYLKSSVLSRQKENSKLKQSKQQTPKKINFEFIKQKRLNTQKTKKVQQKKKVIPNSPYVNHLIQSQTFIKENPQNQVSINDSLQDMNTTNVNTTGNINSRSQLSIRRPVHRSRSHSQQEVPSSRQKSSSRNSINNISSRVYSSYSLNPLNKYGQKRLCNEMNGNKIRKITQLSVESEQLQERMKVLAEQEKRLKEEFRELERARVSREGKRRSRVG